MCEKREDVKYGDPLLVLEEMPVEDISIERYVRLAAALVAESPKALRVEKLAFSPHNTDVL